MKKYLTPLIIILAIIGLIALSILIDKKPAERELVDYSNPCFKNMIYFDEDDDLNDIDYIDDSFFSLSFSSFNPERVVNFYLTDKTGNDWYLYCLDDVYLVLDGQFIRLKTGIDKKMIDLDAILAKMTKSESFYTDQFLHSIFGVSIIICENSTDKIFIGPIHMAEEKDFCARKDEFID